LAGDDGGYRCKMCDREFLDKTSLMEHLVIEHEVLETASYAATTMMLEQERDKIAREFHWQFEQIKKELAGS
jgi:hypothetical protein